MANTAALQEAIDWARGDLERQYDVPFAKSTVRLLTGGTRSFNAVASDGTVVATVLNSSGATSGGRKPVGKLRYAITELYYLSLVQSRHRLLVVTNADFLEYLSNEVAGALVDGIQLVHLPLPPLLAGRVAEVSAAASEEMGR